MCLHTCLQVIHILEARRLKTADMASYIYVLIVLLIFYLKITLG